MDTFLSYHAYPWNDIGTSDWPTIDRNMSHEVWFSHYDALFLCDVPDEVTLVQKQLLETVLRAVWNKIKENPSQDLYPQTNRYFSPSLM
jgi:hypothetical protein